MKNFVLALLAVLSLSLSSCYYYRPMHPHFRPGYDNYTHHNHHWQNRHDSQRDHRRYHVNNYSTR